MISCNICAAQFGPKFTLLVCSKCQLSFCTGHLILSQYAVFHSSITAQLREGHGLCVSCVLSIWGKTDEDLTPAKGILGRSKKGMTAAWDKTTSLLSREPLRVNLVKISEDSFSEFNTARAFAIFRNQAEVTQEFIVAELTEYARLFAVSQGRLTEKGFSLTDIYYLVDWLRTHPNLPNWSHGISWSLIESSPTYLSYVSDVWHVAQSAIALSNPATASATLAYHLGDRALDQKTGKGLFATGYETVKDKLGLNINPKKAILCYLAGLFVLQLLKRR